MAKSKKINRKRIGPAPTVLDDLWIYLALDPDGNEGMLHVITPGENGQPVVVYMLGNEERVQGLAETAVKAASDSGMSLRLVKFSTREVMGEWKPKKGSRDV